MRDQNDRITNAVLVLSTEHIKNQVPIEIEGIQYVIVSEKTEGVTAGYFLAQKGETAKTAMLKKPKASDAIGVLREVIAIGIAAKLDYQAADCRIVFLKLPNGEVIPTIFSKFSQMTPLTQWITGNNARENKATIKPVGEGWVPNASFASLTHLLAYLIVMGDADSIGKDGQNKGIVVRDNGTQALLIFDQMIQGKSAFINNSLQINKLFEIRNWAMEKRELIPFKDVLRHLAYRNLSLITDGPIEEKYRGLLHLLEKEEEILAWLNGLVIHCQQLSAALSTPENKQVALLLQKFASEIPEIAINFKSRIAPLKNILGDQLALLAANPSLGLLAIQAIHAIQQLTLGTSAYSTEGVPLRSLHFLDDSNPIQCIDLKIEDTLFIFRVLKKDHDAVEKMLRMMKIAYSTDVNGTFFIEEQELQLINEKRVRALRHPETLPVSMEIDYLQFIPPPLKIRSSIMDLVHRYYQSTSSLERRDILRLLHQIVSPSRKEWPSVIPLLMKEEQKILIAQLKDNIDLKNLLSSFKGSSIDGSESLLLDFLAVAHKLDLNAAINKLLGVIITNPKIIKKPQFQEIISTIYATDRQHDDNILREVSRTTSVMINEFITTIVMTPSSKRFGGLFQAIGANLTLSNSAVAHGEEDTPIPQTMIISSQ